MYRPLVFGALVVLFLVVAGSSPVMAEGGDHGQDTKSFGIPITGWTWITFAIVFLVLRVTAWKPLVKGLDDRALRIRNDLDRAESERTRSEKLRQEFEERIAKAEEEAARIVADGKDDAEKHAREILDGARTEAEQIKARASKEIDQAKAKALEEVWKQAAELSTHIASKILERAVTADDHRRLIDETIEGYRKELGTA